MAKNKLLISALFSFTLVSLGAPTQVSGFIPKNDTVENMVKALGNSYVEYHGKSVCIYPNLHTLLTLFAGMTITGPALILALWAIMDIDEMNGAKYFPGRRGPEYVPRKPLAIGDIIGASICIAPLILGIHKIYKAFKNISLENKPLIIISEDGITYHGQVFGELKTQHLSWSDIEKIIAQPGDGRDVAIMAKDSRDSFFVPEYNLPITYEEFSKIAARYSWLAWAEAEKDNSPVPAPSN